MAQLQLKNPIVFFDLETTGIDAGTDRIVEIACIKLLPNGTKEEYLKRVNPGMPIPAEATAIHGITNEDVADAPHFHQIATQLYDWMKGCDLGGYNAAKFDLPLLAEEFLRAKVPVDFTERKLVDVQQIFFKMEARTLEAAYKFYCEKKLDGAHTAAADISATVEILESQLDKYEELPNDVAALHTFCGGDDAVDYARRIVKKDGVPVFNFGKYKGQAVATVFEREPNYYDWMIKADFPLHTKQKLTEILTEMKLKKLKH